MRRLLTLTLVLGLLIVACGGGEEGTTTSTSAALTTTMAPDTTEAADMTTTTAAAATTTTEALSAGGDDCLVGTWTLDSEVFVENFDEIMTGAEMPDSEVTALDGTFEVEMNADGTYLAVRDEWGFRMATPEGTVIIEINGDETGTWSTSGTTLSINPGDNSLTVDVSMEVDGETFPFPGTDAPIETPPGLATNSEFECSGDILTLANEGVESVLNRN